MRITAVKAVTDWRTPLRGNRPNTAYRRTPSTTETRSGVDGTLPLPPTQTYSDALENLQAIQADLNEDNFHEYHDTSSNRTYIDADWWPADMAAQQELGLLPFGWLGDGSPDHNYTYASRAYLDTTSLARSKDFIKTRIKRAFQRKAIR